MRINSEASYHWERILAAFNYECAYCGASADEYTMCKEHMMPKSRGGDDSIENVVPSCRSCNSSKGNLTPLEWFLVEEGALRRTGPTGYDTLVVPEFHPEFGERRATVYNDHVVVYGETKHSYRCRWPRGWSRCVLKDIVHFIDSPVEGDWVWLAEQAARTPTERDRHA